MAKDKAVETASTDTVITGAQVRQHVSRNPVYKTGGALLLGLVGLTGVGVGVGMATNSPQEIMVAADTEKDKNTSDEGLHTTVTMTEHTTTVKADEGEAGGGTGMEPQPQEPSIDPPTDPGRDSAPWNATDPYPAQPGSIHIVEAGETLSIISGRTGVSIDRLITWNQVINPDLIYVGSALEIPPLVPEDEKW